MAAFVVDASVLAALYVDDPLSEASSSLLTELAGEQADLHAPDLIGFELANVFVKALRRGELDAEGCIVRIEAALAWDIEWHRPDRLIASATALALVHELTAYDAAHLALALALGATLLTGDRILAERSRAAGAPVRHLIAA